MRTRVLTSQDLYLHIALGRWILTHRQIPDHDIFSFSVPGVPWVAHEWLASFAAALIYDSIGWGGIVVAAAFIVALAIAALTLESAPQLGPVGALGAATLGWGLCINHLQARPHLVALPLLVIWIAGHVRARHANGIPPLYLLVVMLIWANIHGSFLLGLTFTGLFLAEAMFEANSVREALARGQRWSLFLAFSLLASLITPYGLSGILFPIHLITMGPVLEGVREWKASSLSNNPALIVWCLLVLFVVLWRGLRLPICRLFMFVVLLYMAFAHLRYTEYLGLLTPLLLMDAIAESPTLSGVAAVMRWNPLAHPRASLPTAAAAVLTAIIFAIAAFRNADRPPDAFTPAAALAAVAAHGVSGHVLNAYNFGGYLIFRGYAPFIDGRVDVYGRAFVSQYFALDQLTRLIEQYHIAWTIFEPNNPRSVVMDNLSGWSRLYADGTAVVHVRNGGAPH